MTEISHEVKKNNDLRKLVQVLDEEGITATDLVKAIAKTVRENNSLRSELARTRGQVSKEWVRDNTTQVSKDLDDDDVFALVARSAVSRIYGDSSYEQEVAKHRAAAQSSPRSLRDAVGEALDRME